MSIPKPNLLMQVRKIIHLFWQPYKPYQYAVSKLQKIEFNVEEKNLNANCIFWWTELYGLGRTFKFVPSKHTQTSIWYARPFSISF